MVQESDMPQLLVVFDENEHVRMLYRGIISNGQSVVINMHSTALAMVTCNPTMAMAGDSNYSSIVAIIENLQSFSLFENYVRQQVSAGKDLFDTTDTQMFRLLQAVNDELLDTTNGTKFGIKDTGPMPWADYAPLKCEWLTPSNPGRDGAFYLSNFALVPSYYGTITTTSGSTQELKIPTVDRYTLGSLALGVVPGVDVAHGDRVLISLSRDANNTIELTNLHDYRAVLDFGAHFLGDIIAALSLPVDIADKDMVTLAQNVGSIVMDAITDDSPCNYRLLANTTLHFTLEYFAKQLEKNILEASEKAWAKKMCDIGVKRILAWYNMGIGVTNLVARITYWAVYPHDISFCAWYGREESVMQVKECKDVYTVSYEVENGVLSQNGDVNFEMEIHLCGDVRGLRNADEYGYYIKYANSYEYHKVQSLNPTEFDEPYTYTLTIEDEEFQTVEGVKVAKGFYIGFYVVRNNRNKIDYYDEQEIEGLVYPDQNDWVDLGLPSGLLWATRNVGASSPTDYGNYYAWGETSPKSVYNWDTYRYYNSSTGSSSKYTGSDGLTILQPGDDAATANYGGRTPTKEEWQELTNNTTSQWITINGVNGRCFTGSNGNSLFLPAAGARWGSSLYRAGSKGYYWSSSLVTDDPRYAWYFRFGSDDQRVYDGDDRSSGFTVRAVR